MAMPVERRREISRQNGRRSRGPKTMTGKKNSRLNATTHALSSQTLVPFAQEDGGVFAMLEEWLDHYKPDSAETRALIERAVVAAFQKRRCIAAIHRSLQALAGKTGAVAAVLGYEEAATTPSAPGGAAPHHREPLLYRRDRPD